MLVHARVNACFELKIENGTSTDVGSNLGFEMEKAQTSESPHFHPLNE